MAGCSSTQTEPQQTPVASDVAQDKIDQFCRDLADAPGSGTAPPPRGRRGRISELSELANELS